jgi:hypothetical protein
MTMTLTNQGKRMNLARLLACSLALTALAAAAQTNTAPDLKESQQPAPPAFDTRHLIAIQMPGYVSLRFGIDPATLSVSPDGIVSYVVVASSASGSVNAMFEGIRCATGEVKTYARYNASGQWTLSTDPQWQDMNGRLLSRHALALARQGLCEGRSAAGNSGATIGAALKNQNPNRF